MTRENFMNRFNSIRAGMGMLKRAAVLALVTTVAACTAGGPATTQTQQTTPGGATSAAYNGPAANNADVTAFQTALWVNVRKSGPAMCGNCHSQTGTNQAPMFARDDNVNDAYAIANQYVDFADPANSKIVLKAVSGHNCWLAAAQACGDTMLQWVKAWIGSSSTSTSSGPPRGGRTFSSRETLSRSRQENDLDSDVESKFRRKPELALSDIPCGVLDGCSRTCNQAPRQNLPIY